ncbi:MAG: O-antigen polysaccharide polymerase Wzy [Armatimonadetes bacterium]|nr:O-antigen polysaccharide polymerase Wzy [Armatimonadota bacterium]
MIILRSPSRANLLAAASVERQRQQRQKSLLRLLFAFLLFVPVPIFGALVVATTVHPAKLLLLFSLLALAQLMIAVAGELWINHGYLLSAKTLFWTSLVFFHAAGATARVTQVRVAADSLLRAGFWCLLGIAAACAAGLLVPVEQTVRFHRPIPSPRALALSTIGFLLAGTASFAYFVNLWGWANYFLRKYSMAWLATPETGSIAAHVWRLSQLLWHLGIWMVVIGLCEFRSLRFKLLIPVVFLIVLVQALGGTRGPLVCGLLVAMLVRHKRKPYTNLSVALAAILAIASFGPIAVWRVHRLEAVSRLQSGALIQESLESGCQLRVVAVATELFPTVYEYSWGRSYFAQTIGKVVPIVGWQLVAGLPDQDLDPGRWITWMKMSEFFPGITIYHVGRGIPGWGYSVIAEAYQNFGGIGVPIILALFGVTAALLDRWFLAASLPGELIACLLIANFLYVPRASFSEVLDGIVIGTVVVSAMQLFCQLDSKLHLLRPAFTPPLRVNAAIRR